MNKLDINKIISKLPDAPGVYYFKRGKEILYIGKATSLRDRVRSYFSSDIENTRGPSISKMLSEFDSISYQKTDSVLEALILEAHLIKKHQPPANIMEKDDTSFNYVVITREDFPRVLIMRGRELENNFIEPIKYSFGPFTYGGQLKEAMKIVRRMFPFRDNKCTPMQGKPCFNKQIGLCPGVCTGEISKADYAKEIKNIALFFEGNKIKLIKSLEKEMKDFAKKREFEKAERVRRQIFSLYHIQDVSLIKSDKLRNIPAGNKAFRIESYDIAHLSGTNVVGVMTVIENGEAKKSDYRKFKIKNDPGVNDTKALSEVLSRRLNHPEWPAPDLIVVDGGRAQMSAMQKILLRHAKQSEGRTEASAKKFQNIPIVSVVKDERHKPKDILEDSSSRKSIGQIKFKYEREILLSNAEAHRFAIGFHKQLRGKMF